MEGDRRSGPLAPRAANGRGSLPLVINRENRKPLFEDAASKDRNLLGAAGMQAESRPAMSRNAYSDGTALAAGMGISRAGSVSPSPSITSSNGADHPSRIPRPSSAAGGFSKARRPLSLTEAYRMAESESVSVATESAARARRMSPAAIDGSPSPAPRPHVSGRQLVGDRARRGSDRLPLDLGRHREFSRSLGATERGDDTAVAFDSPSSSTSFNRRFSQYAKDQQRHSLSPSRNRLSGQYEYSRPPPRSTDANRRSTPNTKNGEAGSPPRGQVFAKGHVPKGWVAHLLAREESKKKPDTSPDTARNQENWKEAADIPIPSIEGGHEPTPPSSRPTSSDAENVSPNKSYAWQVDQDFTAGDLQVSDSPRIKLQHDRHGDDDVAARKLSNQTAFKLNQGIVLGKPSMTAAADGLEVDIGQANSKLSSIRRRELNVERELPKSHAVELGDHRDDAPPASRNVGLSEISQRLREAREEYAKVPAISQARPKNTKLDEIRAREKEFLSKRALAASRLEDIRELNSISGSLSPEQQSARARPGGRQSTPDTASHDQPRPTSPSGERIPNTPITIYRKGKGQDAGTRGEAQNSSDQASGRAEMEAAELNPARPALSSHHHRSDSRDILRRLARAASASPGPEPPMEMGSTAASGFEKPEKPEKPEKKTGELAGQKTTTSRNGLAAELPKATTSEAQDGEKTKASVAFLGVRRGRSTDSAKDKRSSMALSDNDPTDRIEGEMKLFAPADNQSERGSVRAPSAEPPSSDEEEEDDDDKDDRDAVEETPRPIKTDPMLLPTPKVTGAFLETPATAKVENRTAVKKVESAGVAVDEKKSADNKVSSPASKAAASLSRARASSRSKETRDQSRVSSSGSGTNEPIKKEVAKEVPPTKTTSNLRRRARSLPRVPLKNSSNPPSARDDLLEMRRAYQIEDDTLDDFERLYGPEKLRDTHTSEQEIEAALSELASTRRRRRTVNNASDNATLKAEGSDLERYDRMGKLLTDGLLGIREAKQGIARLEDQFWHTERPDAALKLEDDATTVAEAKPTRKHPEKGTISKAKHDREHSENPHWACPYCSTDHSTPRPAVTYVHLPVPKPLRLWKNKPFYVTWLGWFLIIFSIWYAAETTVCKYTCAPTQCEYPCGWTAEQPNWGYSIPVTMDSYITDGEGRKVFLRAVEDTSDLIMDLREWLVGWDIRDTSIWYMSFYERQQLRRRLKKRGLEYVPSEARSYMSAKEWDALQEEKYLAEQAELERKEELRKAGYDVPGDETFGDDEKI